MVPGFVYLPGVGWRASNQMFHRTAAVVGYLIAVAALPLTLLIAWNGALYWAAPLLATAAYWQRGTVIAVDAAEAISRGEIDRAEHLLRSPLLIGQPGRLGLQALVAAARGDVPRALSVVRRAGRNLLLRSFLPARTNWALVEARLLSELGDAVGAHRVFSTATRPPRGVALYYWLATNLQLAFDVDAPEVDPEVLSLAIGAGKRAGVATGLLTTCAWILEAKGRSTEARDLLHDELSRPEPLPPSEKLTKWRELAIVRLAVPVPAARPKAAPSEPRSKMLPALALAIGVAVAVVLTAGGPAASTPAATPGATPLGTPAATSDEPGDERPAPSGVRGEGPDARPSARSAR